MQNLLEALVRSGLSHEQAVKAIEVTYEWTSENYPVVATLSRSAIMKPSGIDISEPNSSRDSNHNYPPEINYPPSRA